MRVLFAYRVTIALEILPWQGKAGKIDIDHKLLIKTFGLLRVSRDQDQVINAATESGLDKVPEEPGEQLRALTLVVGGARVVDCIVEPQPHLDSIGVIHKIGCEIQLS